MGPQVITGIRSATPDQTLLNLRPNVLYVALKDPDTETITGKILSINGRKTFTPNNKTAAMLLYLLASDDDDSILLSNFLSLVMNKFNGATTDNIYDFLETLHKEHNILNMRHGVAATSDPDPLGLFNVKENWDPNPDLIPGAAGKEPICKAKTFFSQNAWYVIIPR